MSKIKQEYQKALEDADEKVQLANQIYELVERHLRKLDQEVAKFKMELEADNAGITEVLERRVVESEKQPLPISNNHKAEKRKFTASLSNHVGTKLADKDKTLSSLASELTRDTIQPLTINKAPSNSLTSSPAMVMFDSTPKVPSIAYNLGQVGAGSTAAIAVAASRAIGATLEMQQGRRTASLKASYEAVSKNVDLTKELSLGRELPIAKMQTTSAADLPPVATKQRSKKSSSRSHQHQQLQQQQQVAAVPMILPETSVMALGDASSAVSEDAASASAWQIDPNEPRYCICNDVSYGEMVGCDNEDCPLEWFHYGCVGLLQAPKGKWYCPQCLSAMKRRGRK